MVLVVLVGGLSDTCHDLTCRGRARVNSNSFLALPRVPKKCLKARQDRTSRSSAVSPAPRGCGDTARPAVHARGCVPGLVRLKPKSVLLEKAIPRCHYLLCMVAELVSDRSVATASSQAMARSPSATPTDIPVSQFATPATSPEPASSLVPSAPGLAARPDAGDLWTARRRSSA